jgi:hypothetical protein
MGSFCLSLDNMLTSILEAERERELVGQLFTMGMGIEKAREI